MKSLVQTQRQLAAGEFEFSRHAMRRVVERDISEREIREAGSECEIIEDFPDDKYSPGGLVLGYTAGGRALHWQIGRYRLQRQN